MNRQRKSAGQLYLATNHSSGAFQRANGHIRTATPKQNNKQHSQKKYQRANSTSSVGRIVTRASTPKNRVQRSSKQIGRCYTNTTRKQTQQKMKSIQVQTQQVLACMGEEKNNFITQRYPALQSKQNDWSKNNILRNMSTNKWDHSKPNLLNVADNNKIPSTKNIASYLSSSKNYRNFFSSSEYSGAGWRNQQRKPLKEIIKIEPIVEESNVKEIRTKLKSSECVSKGVEKVVQRISERVGQKGRKKTRTRDENEVINVGRDTKMKQLSQKYEKNMSKYQQHRQILQNLLKNQDLQHKGRY